MRSIRRHDSIPLPLRRRTRAGERHAHGAATSGFTLIELLVVIAIIGVLVALLLPAIQRAREASRRAQCVSNLKQIGVAMHNFHEVQGRLPNGRLDSRGSESSTATSIWTLLLPYLDQGPLWNQIDLSKPMFPNNARPIATSVAAFLCPSDSTPPVRTDRYLAVNTPLNHPAGALSYRGASGSNWDGAPYIVTSSTGRFAGTGDSSCCGNGMFTGGFFDHPDPAQRKEVLTRFADVTDGLSQTVMTGESINEAASFGWWYWNNTTVAISAFPLNLCAAAPSSCINSPKNHGYNSYHTSGANFGRGDGSVTFLNENIDQAVYRDIATIDGQERTAADW